VINVCTKDTLAAAMLFYLARGVAPGWWKYSKAATKREFLNRFPELQNVKTISYNRYGQSISQR
jgi:hypothetical protein